MEATYSSTICVYDRLYHCRSDLDCSRRLWLPILSYNGGAEGINGGFGEIVGDGRDKRLYLGVLTQIRRSSCIVGIGRESEWGNDKRKNGEAFKETHGR